MVKVKNLKITHIGIVKLKTQHDILILKNTLCIPEMKKKLISIERWTRDLGYDFIFNSCGFVSKNVQKGKILLSGNNVRGLYHLWLGQFYSGISAIQSILVMQGDIEEEGSTLESIMNFLINPCSLATIDSEEILMACAGTLTLNVNSFAYAFKSWNMYS